MKDQGHANIHTNGLGTSSPQMNGNSQLTNGATPSSSFDREELIRIVLQNLKKLGYNQTVNLLEKESGYCLENVYITQFRKGIIQGNWSLIEKLSQQLQFLNNAQVLFLIKEQKFLEFIEQGRINDAIQTLQIEISPLNINLDRVHFLSSLLMCPDAETLKTKASWDGSKGTSREKLLLDLQKYIPPTLMVPDNRLEILLNQAITWQRMGCLYHDQEDEPHSLYVNHLCDQAKFPNKTTFILREHTNEVWYLDFANSGQYLASASKDSTIIIWNTTTFHPVHILTGHEDAVNYVAWSPDDKWLLSCSADKTARLWNAETGTTHHIFTEGPDSFSVCVWLPCSTTFLTAGIDQCIRAWNIYGHCLYTIDSHRIYDMAVKSDGSQLIVASDLKKIHVYDLATKSELYTIQEHESITSFKISKDDRYILCNVHNSGARLWDLETRDRVQTFTGQKQKRFVIRSCFGGNNQSFIISGSEDGQVYVWHRNKSVLMYSLPGHTESVNCVAWNHKNDSMFASASDDNTIRIWNSIVPPTKPLD